MTTVDDTPSVSVILVNYRGCDDTLRAVESIYELEWPQDLLEIVVVENASGDDSARRIRQAFPQVKVVEAGQNLGFAGGCNLGVLSSSGQYVAFLNNDARAHPGWITEAVAALAEDRTIGCIASKVLTWDGSETDFVDAGMTYYGHAFKLHHDEPDDGRWDEPKDVLFPTGAAMVMSAALFHELRGFDEQYFMFFEDVDLGWRTWLAGHRVRFVPTSIVYHRHHASMKSYGSWLEHFLLERNALYTLYKNLDDATLNRVLPAALLLTTRRGTDRARIEPEIMDLAHGPTIDDVTTLEVGKSAVASLLAQDDFLTNLPQMRVNRDWIQATRRCSDAAILSLFRRPNTAVMGTPRFVQAVAELREVFELDDVFAARRVLVVTNDVLGPRMAGPAIRAHQIAGALAREHHVTLASLGRSDLSNPDFTICYASGDELQRLVDWSEIIIFQGHFLVHNPWLTGLDRKVLVVDLYDPFQLENLELAKHLQLAHRVADNDAVVGVINQQVSRGDFFLCASEKQRDFWLGNLSALGRLNPKVYDQDESLRSFLDVVPFGLSDHPPERTGPGIRGVVEGISDDDKVIIWGGGIYNWFDPCTLIRAVDDLRHRIPNVRLFFMGTKHPNPDVPEMRVAVEAIELAKELGLLDTYVFFNEGWVPYDDRQNFLLDADIGVSTHFQHVETAFSFRTRVLDYFWAELPVVTTEGDSLSAVVKERGIGITVPPENVPALSDALYVLLTDDEIFDACRTNLKDVRTDYMWDRALKPLLEFCRHAERSADQRHVRLDEPVLPPPPLTAPAIAPPWRWHGLRHDLGVARVMLEQGGVSGLVSQARMRIRRLTKGPS